MLEIEQEIQEINNELKKTNIIIEVFEFFYNKLIRICEILKISLQELIHKDLENLIGSYEERFTSIGITL